MSGLTITILDPDTSQADRAATRLQALLKSEGISACVLSTSCYLEIARQGMKGKTPVISVGGVCFQCNNLDDSLIAHFATWLAHQEANHLTELELYNERTTQSL